MAVPDPIVYSFPKFIVADTQAGLDTGTAFECSLTAATLTPSVSFNTIPSRGCSGPIQSPGAATWTLQLDWLQDWKEPGGGLSGWAWTNRLQPKWFRLIPDKNDTTIAAEGQAFVVPGGMGGTFGDGSAGTATAQWQLLSDPEFDFPASTMQAAEDVEPAAV
jgi:hypothetical protein